MTNLRNNEMMIVHIVRRIELDSESFLFANVHSYFQFLGKKKRRIGTIS